MRKPNYDK